MLRANVGAILQATFDVNRMSYRRTPKMTTPKMTMNGFKSRTNQRGIGQWWMILTIGLMVGFIFGFILFLSRLPDDHYTLVETERGIEQIQGAEADQYAFYDRLAEERSAVPNAAANELPVFTRDGTAGKFGADINERPTAVEISDQLRVGADVTPVEIAATTAIATTSGLATGGSVNTGALATATESTTIKRTVDRPSTSYYLQAGAFASGDDAVSLRRRLNQSGMDAFIKKVAIQGQQWHRVRIGPFYDSRSLNSAETKLARSGISYLVIKVQS